MKLLALVGASNFLGGFRYSLLTAAIALIVSWVLTPWVRNIAIAKGAVDDPNRDERRVHKEPIPKLGGLAIYAGILFSLLGVLPFAFKDKSPWMPPYLVGILTLGAVLVVVGALDDLYAFSAKVQATLLLAVGLLVQLFGDSSARIEIQTLGIPLSDHAYISIHPVAGALLTAAYIVVVTKTMDTIDGIDGLAAGIATISAATLCVIATYCQQPRVAIVAAAIGGSALGFLKHNYNPAKIFMGTGGAYVLGFMLACLSIVGALKTAAAVSLLIPVTVFGVPIFDAFFVIARRIYHREPITQADKRHLHHTLLKRGLSQRQAVLVLYVAAMTLCGAILYAVVNLKHA
ncbi:MAG TPA: MraY family glycosyltransferase [Fimbriimonas sp.]|nr:MraY family glycosyltransferase [Fimbriimonas sp.]